MSKTSKICEIHVFIVYVQDHSNRTLRRVRGGTQKAIPTKRRHCTGPTPSEEVAPWNTGTARDQALPEDNGTLYPNGSLFVVNKIKYIHFMSKIVKIHVL